jgi:hypothetical protein
VLPGGMMLIRLKRSKPSGFGSPASRNPGINPRVGNHVIERRLEWRNSRLGGSAAGS